VDAPVRGNRAGNFRAVRSELRALSGSLVFNGADYDPEGDVVVTVPETVVASVDEIAPALAAS